MFASYIFWILKVQICITNQNTGEKGYLTLTRFNKGEIQIKFKY